MNVSSQPPMHQELNAFCVGPERSIHEAVVRLDASRLGIVLVVSEDRKLLGTVTDGDVRRAMLDHVDFARPVTALLERKSGTRFEHPVTVSSDADSAAHLGLLKKHGVLHLPVVDSHGRVVGLVTRDQFLQEEPLPIQAVIMAGGAGLRLMPLTKETPKPMLAVGERPLLEILVKQLRDAGLRHLHVATHHASEKIREHFGDGRKFGVEMTLVQEDVPLGTAGALSLMAAPATTTLVINGDILTNIDIPNMLAFHREHGADLTVAVKQYSVRLPYGVVECDGPIVRSLVEKPSVTHFVNAGIYLFEPAVQQLIPRNVASDMTDLIQRVLDAGRPVCSFPIREYWLDIGERVDYEKAQEEVKELRLPL